MPAATNDTILALDVGDKRIGVAVAGTVARLAHPLTTLPRTGRALADIRRLAEQQSAVTVVVGLPRSLDGQETAQTVAVREFAKQLQNALTVPIELQDEALTSVQAETELHDRAAHFAKADVDALAATYILEDYLRES